MKTLNLLVTFYMDHYQCDNQDINRKMFKNITWSPFDRIVFTEAHSFKELCGDNDNPVENHGNVSNYINKNDLTWTGVKQCMHLIEERFEDEKTFSPEWILLSNESNNEKIKSNDSGSSPKPIFIINDINDDGENVEIKYAFHCIYSMRFSEEIQNLKYGDQIYDKESIRKDIFQKIRKETKYKKIVFRCFRSLGSEDMVIILLADSMKDIVSTVDYINRLKVKLPTKLAKQRKDEPVDLFSTVCVFSGLNDPEYSEKTDIELIIHLNLKNNNPNEILRELKIDEKSDIDHWNVFLGIGAIILHIPAGMISYEKFHDEGEFNGASEFYKKNIYSSRTYFCISDRNVFEEELSLNVVEEDSLSFLISVDENHCIQNKGEIGKAWENPVANFVFGEYERHLHSQRTIQWHDILTEQYTAVKSFLEYYSRNNNVFDECALLNYAQSSLHLINQACSPVSEVPNHNHFFAGSFHDLIKSYYGIINMLFTLANNLPHAKGNYQHPITFAICLNSVARIESKIFTRFDNKNRIIIFFLPYDSFWNYADNIKYLVHETFHYVAPYDRRFRANCFIKIIYNILVNERIIYITKEKTSRNFFLYSHHKEVDISHRIGDWIDYFVDLYDEIKDVLLRSISDKFPGFFIYSNPEWGMLFLEESHKVVYPEKTDFPNCQNILITIIGIIDSYVKQYIIDYHDCSMKELCHSLSEDSQFFRKEFDLKMTEKKIKEINNLSKENHGDNALYKKIFQRIKAYDLATKEAFCDMWSIKFSGLTIPQYLAFLLKAMSKVQKTDDIIAGIKAVYLRQTKFNMRSTIIRMILLIHKFVNSIKLVDISKVDLPHLLLKQADEKNDDFVPILLEYFEALSERYIQFSTALAKYEIDAVCNIAFHKIDDILSNIDSYDQHNCYTFIKKVAETNLRKSIRIDQIDRLSHFIGDTKPKTKATGSSVSFIRYERIGEDKHYKMLITDFNDFLNAVKDVREKVSRESQSHVLWYRGVCSDRFSLLPSIIRKGNPGLSIYANQTNVIKRAYFSTLYAADIWNLRIEQKMAYLQHYGMPTNLLDFSIDPLTALYFAVNPDINSDRQHLDDGTYQPVVYVFDPMIYSRAIRRMMEWNPNLNIPDTISSVNFDINSNPDEHHEFFVEDMSYKYLYEHNTRYSKAYSPNDRGDPFPVPIVIQQSNPRIIAQSGTFVAYSLHAQPQRCSGQGRFDYLDLLRIQERYLKFLDSTSNFEESFIYPIYLRKSYITSLRKDLKVLNISTGKFYPELNKIFEDVGANGLTDGI